MLIESNLHSSQAKLEVSYSLLSLKLMMTFLVQALSSTVGLIFEGNAVPERYWSKSDNERSCCCSGPVTRMAVIGRVSHSRFP